MPTKHFGRLLGLIIILIISGCSSVIDSKNEGNRSSSSSEGPTITIIASGRELVKNSDRLLSESYRKGMTIRDLLKTSGIVRLTEEGTGILSISGISLGPDMEWELQLDGNSIKDLSVDTSVNHDSKIVITAKSTDGEEALQSVILTVNGGNRQVELTHSYVILFTEDLTVRSLLKSFDKVQLSEDNKNIVSVNDYKPFSNEVWKLKVNGKQLLENGMDMKLRSQDEVEIVLTLR